MSKQIIFHGPWWVWVEDYHNLPPCIEISALHDDTLKQNDLFCKFAYRVATAVLEKIALRDKLPLLKASSGKWGITLVLGECGTEERDLMEMVASKIIQDPSWQGLFMSTHVFTYNHA